MRQKFSEGRIVLALMAALVIEIVLLLLHLGVISFKSSTLASTNSIAGQIVKSQNDLRRRSADSLVWEKSQNEEPVYFHDSVLTLNQSTATLKLFQQTEVNLSENTLVTIEPPDEREHGEIRLRFVKGNLKARNPFGVAKVDGAEWTVDLHQGSEVEFRQVDGENFELQVTKGEALFKSSKGQESTIKTNELLRIDKGQASRMEMDSTLEWSAPPPARLYAHADHMPVSLKWKGHAGQLVLQSLGRAEEIFPVDSVLAKNLDLPLGQHRLFLRDGERTSPALNVQVWRAPVIHLLRPLPRDRVALGHEVDFVWTPVPGLAEFKLVRDSLGAGRLETPAQDNSATLHFSVEQDLLWSIYGRDAEGFEIPPLYSYPLFIRDNPLAAPKLKSPQLRRPASTKPSAKGASFWWKLWREILPEANAEQSEHYEAVFEWEPVEGADQYVLEISAQSDFRHPILIKTLSQAQFSWRDFPLQSYFWRVAAGTKRGRMGMFSEPAAVDLRSLEGRDSVDGVAIRRIETPVPKPAPPPAPVPDPVPVPPPKPVVVAPPRPVAPPFRRLVAWRPVQNTIQFKAKDQVSAKLSGGSATGATVEWPVHLAEDQLLQISAVFSKTEFKPEPQAAYPLQKKLSWQNFDLSALYYKTWWGYGLEAQQTLGIRRAGNETIQSESSLAAGPALAASLESGHFQFRGRLSGLVGGGGTWFGGTLETRVHIWRGFTMGAGLEGLTGSGSRGSSTLTQGFLLTGFDF